MKEQLVTFDTAKFAKEKGFDIKVETFYMGDSEDNFLHNAGKKDNWNNHKCIFNESELSGDYSAPTQSLLQKWFREVHNLSVEVEYDPSYEIEEGKDEWADCIFSVSIVDISYTREWKGTTPNFQRRDGNQFTYEGALEKGLVEALKLI